MQTIFGPVPSRRLGRSLGIDVIPPKTCTYDCLYCESGRTTCLSVSRKTFVDPDVVMADLIRFFEDHPGSADVLTFSSAGEPTLYAELGILIRNIKKRFSNLPLVVLTNGSLLWDPQVRKDLMDADRVVPSLDVLSPQSFEKLNRPHHDLQIPLILEGLCAFRKEYRGQLHVEIMVVSGINDNAEELRKLSHFLNKLAPDMIELNTVVRPPAYEDVEGLSEKDMEEIRHFFPLEKTVVIGKFQGNVVRGGEKDLYRRVLILLRRRPCSVKEMALSLGVSASQLEEAVVELDRKGKIERVLREGIEFLCLRKR